VTEAELQAVLNALTEHGFLDACKNWQKHWEQCMGVEGDYIECDGGQSRKLWIYVVVFLRRFWDICPELDHAVFIFLSCHFF
jgi:hypothetical protein